MPKYILYIIVLLGCSFNLCSQEDNNYRLSMRKATNNGNYNIAMKIFNDAKEDDYYDMESLERIQAEIYYHVEEYNKAFLVCQKLYNEDETNTLTDIIYMCLLSKQGKDNDSLIFEIAQQTIENKFDRNILHNMKILSHKDIEKLLNSLEDYQKKLILREEYKDSKSVNSLLTLLYYYNNRYTDAYNSSMENLTNENNCVIYYILGNLRQKRQEYSSAISFYTLAIREGYNHYDAYLNRAICKGWNKEYVEANKDLDTCLAIDSNYFVFYLKGVNYSHLYQYQDAILQFDYALTLNDTFSTGYNYRGVISTNLKEYEFAVLDFKHAIDINYKTPFAHNNLGMAYEQLGKIENAIEEYKLSTKIEPNFEGGWYNLGRIYTQLNFTSKAIKCLRKASTIAPEIPDIFYLLGINYQKKKDKNKACEYYNTALGLNHTKALNKINNYCNKDEKEDNNLQQEEYNNTEQEYNTSNEEYIDEQYYE